MWAQVERIVSEATTRIVEGVAEFVPGVLALLALLVGAVVVAILARIIVVRMLTSIEFDRRAQHWGLGLITDRSPGRGASALVGRATQWIILILGLLVALTALDAVIPSRFALSVFEYAPNVLAALVVLALGAVLAQFLARAVLIGAVNMQIQSAWALSLLVKWMVLIVAASMAIEQLRIGRQILILAFGILFGGVVLATSLAVGLGAKDAVARAIERELRKPERRQDQVDHV